MSETNTAEISALLSVVKKLRSPDKGCAWDLAQTHSSLKKYLLEEVYEVLEAIDSGQAEDLMEELGDLLFQICLHAQIATDEQNFNFADIAKRIKEKMVVRHPHVFEEGKKVDSLNHLVTQWEEIKAQEKANKAAQSVFSSIPRELPSLARAIKVLKKAERSGLLKSVPWNFPLDIQTEDHLGHILMAICWQAKELKLDPEDILRRQINNFCQQIENT